MPSLLIQSFETFKINAAIWILFNIKTAKILKIDC
jgi:hypothetical protein